jgi:CRISPR/Cas system-associated protein Csx1
MHEQLRPYAMEEVLNEEMANEIEKEVSEPLVTSRDLKKEFLNAVKMRENFIEALKKVNQNLESLMLEIGLNQYIQDPDTLVVHKIVTPKGQFIEFKKIDYVRTRKEGENSGDLSMSEAMDVGFDLGDLGPKNRKKK